ncbi:MAG: hypothetical protein K0S09_2080 [Sphingobacteriaceae bacterium]|jgi:hypothetical protein|nr:hypothetical protein [Sphingobacteriaceae bacterium]
MNKSIICLLVAAAVGSGCATKKAPYYAKQISVDGATKHLTILASDEFEGRETGKPGAEKAAQYIANEFKNLGLEAPVNGSYFLEIPLVEPSFEVNSFSINGKPLGNGKDYYITGTPDPRTINTSEIVFVGYGISSDNYDDLKGLDIAGKTVLLINKDEPMNNGISWVTKTKEASDWGKLLGRAGTKRIQNIQSKKPALILAVSPDTQAFLDRMGGKPLSMAGRLSIKPQSRAANPMAAVVNITPALANQLLANSGTSYDALKNEIDSKGFPQSRTLKANISANYGTTYKDVRAVDVLGYMPGTDLKDEVLVFSAHYDHIGLTTSGEDKVNNGADDDGSGTTGILEIAKAFAKAKKQGKGPRRSILFLANVGEEKGLLGSEYYSEHPVFPMEKTITDLNIDMIGRVDPAHKDNPEYCYLIGSDKLSSTLHKISETANSTYTKLNLDYKYNDPNDPERIYYRSDHYNFAKHNVPIIFYFNGVHEDYHKPSDEVSKINFPLLVKRAQLVFYTGWELANRDQRPAVDVSNNMPQSR